NDSTGATRPIGHLRRNHEGALSAHLHSGNTFVLAADDLTATKHELERLAAIDGAVELASMPVGLARIVEPAGVVNDDRSRLRFGAVSDDDVDFLQFGHGEFPGERLAERVGFEPTSR